ncbi:MAG: hypothetical protein HYW78_03405 [Parcubacteria group bacterium]|nr:hypothetical protein [Parcubacteria group bacterium]
MFFKKLCSSLFLFIATIMLLVGVGCNDFKKKNETVKKEYTYKVNYIEITSSADRTGNVYYYIHAENFSAYALTEDVIVNFSNEIEQPVFTLLSVTEPIVGDRFSQFSNPKLIFKNNAQRLAYTNYLNNSMQSEER